MNQQTPNLNYVVANAYAPSAPEVFHARAPLTSDTQYSIQQRWFDTATNQEYLLIGFTSFGGVLQATWINITGGGGVPNVEQFAVPIGGPITPTGTPPTVTFQDGAGIVIQQGTDSHSINIGLAGGSGQAIQSVTIPGPTDILPNSSNGEITLTSTGSTVTITGSGSTINFDVIGGSPVDSITAGTNINLTGTAKNPIINLNDPVLQQNDSASAPSYSWANSTNSGWYFDNSFSGPALSAFGTEIMVANTSGVTALRDLQIDWQFILNGAVGKSASYIDNGTNAYIGFTSTSSAFTYTLPSGPTRGTLIIVKDESGGAATHNITINTSDSTTIDGQSTFVIDTNYGSVTLLFRANWNII